MSKTKFDPYRVGPRVRKLRKAAKWTQTDLAVELGVSKAWVSRLETKDVTPSLARVIQLAGLFETTPDALLTAARGPRLEDVEVSLA